MENTYELQNWEIRLRGSWPCAYGNVQGNPAFRDGYWIHTSSLMGWEKRGDRILIHTCHSMVLGREDAFHIRSDKTLLLSFLKKGRAEDDPEPERVYREILDLSGRRPPQHFALPDKRASAVVLSLDAGAEHGFSSLSISERRRRTDCRLMRVETCSGKEIVYLAGAAGFDPDPAVQHAGFSYIILAPSRFRFQTFPTGKVPVYLQNLGTGDLELDTPYGEFVLPKDTVLVPEQADSTYRKGKEEKKHT